MKKKKHFWRKICALILTVLAFVATSSFSISATSAVKDTEVVIVNDKGEKRTVSHGSFDTIKKAETSEEIEREDIYLDDDELELVSGGGMEKTEDKFPCIYCDGKYHEMIRIYPYSVRCDGMVYKNMERYLCSRTMRSFYATNAGGLRCIYNDNMELYSRG